MDHIEKGDEKNCTDTFAIYKKFSLESLMFFKVIRRKFVKNRMIFV